MNNTKEVRYDLYCNTCVNKKEPEDCDACNECLNKPFNIDSHKPINYTLNNGFNVPINKKVGRKK